MKPKFLNIKKGAGEVVANSLDKIYRLLEKEELKGISIINELKHYFNNIDFVMTESADWEIEEGEKEILSPEEKAFKVLAKIRNICNGGDKFSFTDDMGGNTLTIYNGEYHSHIGWPSCSFIDLINNLYNILILDQGLGFCKENYRED